ncbi:MAG: ammonia channel protein, partial [Alloalcanivorax xenomutans]
MGISLISSRRWLGWLAVLLLPGVASADTLNQADTAWILTATALVLFMTLPGLSLFYGGLVRGRIVLSVLMQCFAIACLVSLIWLVAGYSLAFTDGGAANAWIGGLDLAFFAGMTRESLSGSLPLSLHALFQMTFAIITPALIVGAFAERMRFGAMLAFSGLWVLLVYVPVCHWVWGGG